MSSENDPLIESKETTCSVDSENYIENIKYIERLKLQQSILNMLIDTDPVKSGSFQEDIQDGTD